MTLMIGAIKKGIPRIGLKQIGVPKIIGSLMLQSPGITDRRPKARYFSTLLRIIKMTKASELPDPPKTEIRNICKFITCVGASPLATKAALAPVAAIPVAKTIGKMTLLPEVGVGNANQDQIKPIEDKDIGQQRQEGIDKVSYHWWNRVR